MDTDICECGYTRSKHKNLKHIFVDKNIGEQNVIYKNQNIVE
jgi:hypothetical protein